MDVPEPIVGSEEWARKKEHPHIPRWGNGKHDPNKCCAGTAPRDGSWFGGQCNRKPKIFYGSLGYCGQHDPAATQKRREQRDAAWRAEWAEKNRRSEARHAHAKMLERCHEAIKQIAAGHNDPRTLANEVLASGEANEA